jgi:enamine deaminase RidA (YjgF/YER057c/UK114 family)
MTYNPTDIDAGLTAMEAAAPGQAEKRCCFARAMVEVSRLVHPELLIELEATAAK